MRPLSLCLAPTVLSHHCTIEHSFASQTWSENQSGIMTAMKPLLVFTALPTGVGVGGWGIHLVLTIVSFVKDSGHDVCFIIALKLKFMRGSTM